MQDSASCCTNKLVMDSQKKERFTVLDWTGIFPDLNTIKNIWLFIKKKLKEDHTTTSLPKLIEAIKRMCVRDMPRNYFKKFGFNTKEAADGDRSEGGDDQILKTLKNCIKKSTQLNIFCRNNNVYFLHFKICIFQLVIFLLQTLSLDTTFISAGGLLGIYALQGNTSFIYQNVGSGKGSGLKRYYSTFDVG
jgi:hypothetical protein